MMLKGITLTRVDWYAYVRRIAGADSDMRIAARIGVTQSTVSRWRDRSPNAVHVIEFARAYQDRGASVPDALMAAYGVTPDELGVPVSMDPHTLSADVLIAEVARRLHAAEEGSAPEDVSTSDRLKRRQAERLSRDPHRTGRGR